MRTTAYLLIMIIPRVMMLKSKYASKQLYSHTHARDIPDDAAHCTRQQQSTTQQQTNSQDQKDGTHTVTQCT